MQMEGQTVLVRIRLLLKEQSDLDPLFAQSVCRNTCFIEAYHNRSFFLLSISSFLPPQAFEVLPLNYPKISK